MVFEHIRKLQEEFTDKYVTVDQSRPELQRFGGLIGRVKTVNFSGRALVEFDEWINNIGWFDIDTSFLKIADAAEVERIAAKKEEGKKAHKAPAEKPAKEAKAEKAAPAAKAPAGDKKPGMSVAEMMAAARGTTGAAPAAKKENAPAKAAPAGEPKRAGGMSVAEMMAAARATAGGAAPAKKAEAKAEVAAEDKPAAAKKEAPAKGADAKGMTVEQMLKLARDQASGKSTPAPAKPESAAPPAAIVAAPAAKAAPEPAAPPAAEKPKGKSGPLPKDVAGIVAYCQQADNK